MTILPASENNSGLSFLYLIFSACFVSVILVGVFALAFVVTELIVGIVRLFNPNFLCYRREHEAATDAATARKATAMTALDFLIQQKRTEKVRHRDLLNLSHEKHLRSMGVSESDIAAALGTRVGTARPLTVKLPAPLPIEEVEVDLTDEMMGRHVATPSLQIPASALYMLVQEGEGCRKFCMSMRQPQGGVRGTRFAFSAGREHRAVTFNRHEAERWARLLPNTKFVPHNASARIFERTFQIHGGSLEATA